MTDDVRPGEVFEIEPSNDDGISFHLPWWLIATAAFVVTELTAHPAIGVIVLCLKFGWNDFLTAWWLRRRDPDRVRGATCSWFYLSSGLWRICLWSFVLLFLTLGLLVAAEFQQLKQAPANQAANQGAESLTCLIVWLLSSAAATVLTVVSVLLAWRRKVKVWVTGSLTHSRRNGLWPPQPKHERRNLLRFWLAATAVPLIGALFLIVLFSLAAFLGAIPVNNAPMIALFALFLSCSILIAALVSVLSFGAKIFARVGAFAPTECWPELLELDYPTFEELRRREWGLPTESANRSDSLNSHDHQNRS